MTIICIDEEDRVTPLLAPDGTGPDTHTLVLDHRPGEEPPGPPPVEGAIHFDDGETDTQTVTNGQGNDDTFPVTIVLDDPDVTGEFDIHNIFLHVSGFGDFNGAGEGVTVDGETGVATIEIRGAGPDGPAGEGAGGGATFTNIGPLSFAVTDTNGDGQLELSVVFTNPTAPDSQVTLWATFDYWLV